MGIPGGVSDGIPGPARGRGYLRAIDRRGSRRQNAGMKQIAGVELLAAGAPGPETSAAIEQPEPDQILWMFWLERQQRSFHGRGAVIDLGDISDE